jgi:hypothetical protein
MVRLFTDDRATRSGGKDQAELLLRAIKLGQRLTLGPPARCHCPSSVSLPRKLTLAGPDQRRLSENVYGMVLDEAGAMSGSGPTRKPRPTAATAAYWGAPVTGLTLARPLRQPDAGQLASLVSGIEASSSMPVAKLDDAV